jgi:hypothetical protein
LPSPGWPGPDGLQHLLQVCVAYIESNGRACAPLAFITAAVLSPSDAQQKRNRRSRSSTVWISAQPVSRFAPPRGLGDRACDNSHAPLGSQHLRILNLRVHGRKVKLTASMARHRVAVAA